MNMIGRVIGGRFDIIEEIGRGGFAIVYLAHDQRLNDMPVAIKYLLPEHARNPEVLGMFKDEIQLQSRLNHPNIRQIRDTVQEGDDYFVVFEYIDGADLCQLIARAREQSSASRTLEYGQRIPPHLGAYIVLQICHALDLVHNLEDTVNHVPLGIVHRDVTPDNVMVSFAGEVKLTDFGIAKARVQVAEQTKAGTVKGKHSYMSPEQIQAKRLDHTSDIYSLGIVLYETLTGEKLFTADNDMALLMRVAKGGIDRDKLESPAIPAGLRPVLAQALQPNPAKRYHSAQDMAEDLTRFLADKSSVRQELAHFVQALFRAPVAPTRKEATEFVDAAPNDDPPAGPAALDAEPVVGSKPPTGSGTGAPGAAKPVVQGERTIIDIVRIAAYSGRRFFAIGGAIAAVLAIGLLVFDMFGPQKTPIARRLYYLFFPPVARIESYPKGAQVQLDRKWLNERTPTRISKPGPHDILLRLEGYEDIKQHIVVDPKTQGQVTERRFTFEIPVDIVTEPVGAKVLWNGVTIGTTPILDFKAEVGPDPVVFELSQEGFAPLVGKVDLGHERHDAGIFLDIARARYSGSKVRWQVKGTFYAVANIDVSPEGANAVLDEQSLDVKAGRVTRCLGYGRHTLTANRTGFIADNRTIEVTNGDTQSVRIALRRRVYVEAVDAQSETEVSWAAVRVDGRTSSTSAGIPLTVGSHDVVVSAEGYEDTSGTIRVPVEGQTRFRFRLPRGAPVTRLRVLDRATGTSVPGVYISAYNVDGTEVTDLGRTNEDGMIVTSRLDGPYLFETWVLGGSRQRESSARKVGWGGERVIELKCDIAK